MFVQFGKNSEIIDSMHFVTFLLLVKRLQLKIGLC